MIRLPAMTRSDANPDWTIDFSNHRARRGSVEIGFEPVPNGHLALTYLHGRPVSLERQCEIAGEALEAIDLAQRRRRLAP